MPTSQLSVGHVTSSTDYPMHVTAMSMQFCSDYPMQFLSLRLRLSSFPTTQVLARPHTSVRCRQLYSGPRLSQLS